MDGEREGEKYQLVASPEPPTGDLVCNPGMCPGQESNLRHFSLREDAQPPGPSKVFA